MKRKSKEPTEAEIRAEINREFSRWNEIAWHGCQDPGWEDGVNMRLVRNHILFYYYQLAEHGWTLRNLFGEYPEERPVPPEVPMRYMVRNGRYPSRLENKRTVFEKSQIIWGYAGEYAV